jgi:chromate transporter
MREQWQIFLAFFRIGIFGFGGGPSMIPLFHKEVVEQYKWMNDEQFSDVLAIGNTLPGPIATKMAGYIGFKVAGISGCINAVIANILPSIIAMIALLSLLGQYKEKAWVQGMAQGVIPIVIVMMAMLTNEFFKKSHASLGALSTALIATVSFIAIDYLSIHPGVIILLFLIVALLRKNSTPIKASSNIKKGAK